MPARDPASRREGRRRLDWVAAGAGLLGSGLLLARRAQQPAPAAPQPQDDAAPLDSTARFGRGRPGTPPGRKAREVGHEVEDAHAGKVALVMAALAASAILSVVVLFFLLDLFHAQLHAARPTLTREQTTQFAPAAPLLETHPHVDLDVERARENRMLDGYAWRDAAHTRAHIPIAQAMALVVGRSLDAAP